MPIGGDTVVPTAEQHRRIFHVSQKPVMPLLTRQGPSVAPHIPVRGPLPTCLGCWQTANDPPQPWSNKPSSKPDSGYHHRCLRSKTVLLPLDAEPCW